MLHYLLLFLCRFNHIPHASSIVVMVSAPVVLASVGEISFRSNDKDNNTFDTSHFQSTPTHCYVQILHASTPLQTHQTSSQNLSQPHLPALSSSLPISPVARSGTICSLTIFRTNRLFCCWEERISKRKDPFAHWAGHGLIRQRQEQSDQSGD